MKQIQTNDRHAKQLTKRNEMKRNDTRANDIQRNTKNAVEVQKWKNMKETHGTERHAER